MNYSLLADPQLANVVIVGLATWRITYMLVNERGPFALFTRFRALTGIKHNSDGLPIIWPNNNPLSCMFCTSVYVGLVFSVLPIVIVAVGAAISITMLLEKLVGHS